MNRTAWKNRFTLGLGAGIATIALIAGCADDEGDDDVGIDTDTDAVATETVEGTETMEATETATTDATETATAAEGSDDPAEGEDVTLTISAGSVMMDGTMASDVSLTTGSTVTFENDGEEAVTISTDDGAIDEEIDAGGSYEFTFEEAGTWTLSVDGTEAATITVE